MYEAKDESFVKWDQNNSIIDNKGIKWQLEENYIESDNGQILYRLPFIELSGLAGILRIHTLG